MPLLKRDDGASKDLNASLGAGTQFEGQLGFEGTVRIDGSFSGSIHKGDKLVVGAGATVTAEITCESVVVHGEVTGNIRAGTVELRQGARVRGDIATPSLVIERGALLEGHVKVEAATAEVAPGTTPSVGTPAVDAGTGVPPPLVAVNG